MRRPPRLSESRSCRSSRPTTSLSPLAAPSYPAARARPEEECTLRTPFQRDRDRIVHCKAFRRLKHKTQVFVAPEGDHYRTRLTHTLETTQISRTVGRALGLNEDLVGGDRARPRPRPPAVRPHRRGRAGPLRARALRPRLPPQRALAAGRRRARAAQPHRAGARRDPAPLQRGGRARDARGQDRAPRRPHRLHQPRHRRRRARGRAARSPTCRRRRSPSSATPARAASTGSCTTSSSTPSAPGDIVQGEEVGGAMLRLRGFMFQNVYLGPTARAEHAKIERVMRGLFEWFCDHPEELPAGGGRGADAGRPRDRLPGRHDRPLRHPRLDRARGAPGPARLVPRYTSDSRERVRDAIDFVELVNARTELRKSGQRRYTGLCPFHDERTPSFGIDPVEKLYHCFGCGEGGDVFKFVMETEGLDFGVRARVARRPRGRRARGRGGGPEGRQAARPREPAARPARAHRRLLRARAVGVGARPPTRASTCSAAG